MEIKKLDLKTHIINSGAVEKIGASGYRFSIPAGGSDNYRLAQLDDYAGKSRRDFDHHPPLRMSLQARVSSNQLPGTWGFGLWNDPFSVSIGHGGNKLLPALPQAVWFFSASEPNWLSLHAGVPGDGFFAGVIRSPSLPIWLFSPLLLGVPMMVVKPGVRLARWLTGKLVHQAGKAVTVDPTEWHHYQLDWTKQGVHLSVDSETVMESDLSPTAPLGLVLWIDNQYARLTPQGGIGLGTLSIEKLNWLEIQDLAVQNKIE